MAQLDRTIVVDRTRINMSKEDLVSAVGNIIMRVASDPDWVVDRLDNLSIDDLLQLYVTMAITRRTLEDV